MKAVIVGAGGHGMVVLDILRSSHQLHVAGFLDSNSTLHGTEVEGVPVLGDMTVANELARNGIEAGIVAIGDNRTRSTYAKALAKWGISLAGAIHPASHIAASAELGDNVVIAAGAILCANAIVADSVILNTGCSVDYGCRIGEAVHICPGAKLAGRVTVEPGAFVGIGAVVIEGVTIGQSAIVGAGAVVIDDVPAYSTVVGVPASAVRQSHLQGVGQTTLPSTADLEPARSIVRPKRQAPSPSPVFAE